MKTEGTTDHRDWYSYAVKLEDSVKYQRKRVTVLEKDLEVLNQKFRDEIAAKEEFQMINKKLAQELTHAR